MSFLQGGRTWIPFAPITGFLLSVWFGTVVDSLPWDGPVVTPITQSPASTLGWTPRPTNIAKFDLIKRDDSATSRCGYINAISSAPLVCPSGLACAFNTAISGVGCCVSSTLQAGVVNYAGCRFYTTCYDQAMLSACDDACQKNSLIRKCSAVDNPSCYKWDFKDIGHRYWGCTSTHFNSSVNLQATTTQDASLVSNGAFIAATVLDPLLWATLTFSSGAMALESGVVGSSGVCTWGCWGWNCAAATPCQASLTCNAGYCRDVGFIPSTAATTAKTTASSTSSKVDAPDHKMGTGAIVGASVGGTFALLAVAGLLFFVFRKKTGEKEAEAVIGPTQEFKVGGHQEMREKAELDASDSEWTGNQVTIHEVEGDRPVHNSNTGTN